MSDDARRYDVVYGDGEGHTVAPHHCGGNGSVCDQHHGLPWRVARTLVAVEYQLLADYWREKPEPEEGEAVALPPNGSFLLALLQLTDEVQE
jgi:hypothetical protein